MNLIPFVSSDALNTEVPELDLARRAEGDLDELAQAAASIHASRPSRIDANEENAGRGVAKLVLSLVDLLRQLLERQAIRRMDAGSLTDEQVERMGETFLKLTAQIEELKIVFGLEDEDLELGLGTVRELTE